MAEERIPTFIPGDEIVYRVEFLCKVNVVFVSAAFRNETTGGEIILEGEADMVAQPRVRGARTFMATLYQQFYDQEIVEEEVVEEEVVDGEVFEKEVVEKEIVEEIVDQETSDEPEAGRYRLARLTAETFGGKILDFDNPPEDAFLFEEEPEEVDLPTLARGIVKPASGFLLPDGHPNRRPTR